MSSDIHTPRTDIRFATLGQWVAAARRLDRRRCSHLRHVQIANHFTVLPLDLVKACDDETALRELPGICEALHLKPVRGRRGGTKWELVNMAVRNRLWQLERQRDLNQLEGGDNWRRAHA